MIGVDMTSRLDRYIYIYFRRFQGSTGRYPFGGVGCVALLVVTDINIDDCR